MYNNDDIILTEFGEVMFYEEAKTLIERIATKIEADDYLKELEYWRKQCAQEQHEGSYHELPE